MQTMNPPDDELDSLEARARSRVARKMGFYVHACVFVFVNLGLYAISAVSGDPHWARFPLMGWGMGLGIHGVVTFVGLQGEGLRQTLLDREMAHLRGRKR